MMWRAENVTPDYIAALKRLYHGARVCLEVARAGVVAQELEKDIPEPRRKVPLRTTPEVGMRNPFTFDAETPDADAYLRSVLGREDAR